MLTTTTAGLALTIAACALLTASTPLVLIGIVVGLSGVFRSIGLTGYNTMAFSDVPDAQMRDANTLAVAAQQLSIGLGVAFAAVALRAGEPLGELLPGREEPAAAYSAAFLIVALAAAIACARALRLHPAAGDVLRVGRGRRQRRDQ